MKRGRRVFLVLLAGAVTALAIALVWPVETEPVYKGKKLSQWLAVYERKYSIDPHARDAAATAQAAAAVREIGTNALPCLLRWLAHEDPAWGSSALGLAGRVVRPVSQDLSDRLWARGGSFPSRRAWDGICGFEILGADARSAIPGLTSLVNGARYQVSVNAMLALRQVGTEGLPVLLTVATNTMNPLIVTNPRSYIRTTAVAAVGSMGTNAYPAVPVLVGCLQDKDRRVALMAAHELGRLHTAPDLVVPALAKGLTNPNVRSAAVFALGMLGEEARPAVPALVSALSDRDLFMRQEATNALRKIAPEVLDGTNGPQTAAPGVLQPAGVK